MKKTILLAVVLLGTASVSQAGVRFSLGIGIPFPAPVVVSPPPVVYQAPPVYYSAPAPVYQAPAPIYQAPAPVYQAPPRVVYAAPPVVYVSPAPVCVPRPVFYLGFGTGWRGHGEWGHRGWRR